jgi:[ribosomal protein S5]-alanine N-acetyltransferase
MVFKGETVFLRPLVEADINDAYLSWFNDTTVTEFVEAKNISREDAIAHLRDGIEKSAWYMYAICTNENDRHIGNVKIGPIDSKHMYSDLVSIIGDRSYWGKGIATEAIRLGNSIAFEQYGIRKLTGGMYDNNYGSIKCYTEAGWVVEARLKGQYVLDGIIMDRVVVSCFNPRFFKTRFGDLGSVEASEKPAYSL